MPIEMERLYAIARKSLQARQMEMEVISDNLANVNTTGFKSRRTSFEAALSTQQENLLRRGVEANTSAPDFAQGMVQATEQSWDLAIDGPGLFTLRLANGQTGYTRIGDFHPDAQGRLVNDEGALLWPPVTVPPGATEAAVDSTGTVTALVDGNARTLGRLQLARFANPEALIEIGDGVYGPSPASGPAVMGGPSDNGMGQIVGGALETSNVDAGQEMVDLLRVQRSYNLALKALQVSDQMTAITNQIMG